MTHKFEAKNKLDYEKRRELLPPEQTLIRLGLYEGESDSHYLKVFIVFLHSYIFP